MIISGGAWVLYIAVTATLMRRKHCGKIDAGYVGTCGCGYDKAGNIPVKKPEPELAENPRRLFCTACGETDGGRFQILPILRRKDRNGMILAGNNGE